MLKSVEQETDKEWRCPSCSYKGKGDRPEECPRCGMDALEVIAETETVLGF